MGVAKELSIIAAILVGPLVLSGEGLASGAFPKWDAPGPNIARGRPYEVKWAGKCLDYALTKDEGDKVQLTDGALAPPAKQMWWFKETFGRFMGTVGITIDLGDRQSIAGVGYSTENGPHAGVGYPPAILVLVSDDGKEFRAVGELVGLAAKFGPPPAVGRHWFRTDDLKAHGRYVQLVVQSGLFVFSDEIEVYQGKPEYLDSAQSGPVVAGPPEHLRTNIMPYAVSARLATDAARARAQIETIAAPDAIRRQAGAKLEKLRQAALKLEMVDYSTDFHAVAPLNPVHAQVFAAMAPVLRAAGYPEFLAWTSNRWARQSPFDPPPAPAAGEAGSAALHVRLMQNDRRGEVLNVANFGPSARAAVVSVSGLPGGAKPGYLTVRRAEYVAMASRPWDADVLPAAEAVGDGWRVSLPAGLSRQLWLDFLVKPGSCPPGTHQGELVVKVQGGPELRVPLALVVAETALPDSKAVTVGCWDYVHGGSRKAPDARHQPGSGLCETNVDAAIAHMRESGVTAAWAHLQWSDTDVVPFWCRKLKFDEANNLVSPPDYTTFDRWVKSRPEARYYALYCGVYHEWKDTKMGSDAFQQRLTAVTQHWAAHIRQLGIDPRRIVLSLFDEPRFASAARQISGWAEVIHAAVPEFKFYLNPMFRPESYGDPEVIKAFELMDFVTPGTEYSYHNYGQAAVDFYESIRAKGKNMGFYSCAQNPSEAEAIRYYRLQQWACWSTNKGGRESWAGFWSYSDTRSNPPWNQLPCGHDRNWSPVYIDSKSVTDGKHWLAIFEGVNDYEYLLMLKDRIAEARKAGRNPAAVAAAQKLLDTLPDEAIAAVRGGKAPAPGGETGGVKPSDINACDAGRLRVLDALESLAK